MHLCAEDPFVLLKGHLPGPPQLVGISIFFKHNMMQNLKSN